MFTLIAVILPSLSALILFSIFMASKMMITCPFFTVSPTFTLISRITPGSGDFTPDLPVEAAAGFTTGVAGAAGADVAAYQAHDAWAQADEDALHHRCVHIFIQHFADQNHQDKRGENQGEGGRGTSEYCHHAVHACIVDSSIATIGGGVDTDRSRCHL